MAFRAGSQEVSGRSKLPLGPLPKAVPVALDDALSASTSTALEQDPEQRQESQYIDLQQLHGSKTLMRPGGISDRECVMKGWGH